MPRFVILRHEMPPGSERRTHWDFMLEREDVLWTWALPQPPSEGRAVPAIRLADHRKAYLDYEGDVSGARGRVERFDQGDFDILDVRRDHGGGDPCTAGRGRAAGHPY